VDEDKSGAPAGGDQVRRKHGLAPPRGRAWFRERRFRGAHLRDAYDGRSRLRLASRHRSSFTAPRLWWSRWPRGFSSASGNPRERPTGPGKALAALGWSANSVRAGDPGAAKHDDRPVGLSGKRRPRSMLAGERRRGSRCVGRGGSAGLRDHQSRPSISAFLAASSSSRLRSLVISCLISCSSAFSCHVRR